MEKCLAQRQLVNHVKFAGRLAIMSSSAYLILLIFIYHGVPFLFTAQDCKELDLPEGATLEMRGEYAVIQCGNSQETYYLVCDNGDWLGHMGTCTDTY